MKTRVLLVLICFLALSLTGCAVDAPLKLPNISKTSVPANGSGLFVSRVILKEASPGVSSHPPVAVVIIDDKNLFVASAVIDLQVGENFRVIELPPGHYSWRGIYIGGRSAEFRGNMPFDITANSACYVGDVEFTLDWTTKRYGIKVVDRRQMSQYRYEDEFPSAAKAFPFTVSLTEDKRVH